MGASIYLIAVSCAAIALAIWLIAKVGLHPFLGLLCGATLAGLASGIAPQQVVVEIEKGFADILRGIGLVVALGLSLGAILQISGGAQSLAARALAMTGQRYASWGALAAALLIGLPLFFETGTVLLLPIIVAGMANDRGDPQARLRVMLSALAGLSVLHALMPPHPGPLIAVNELKAPLLPTMAFGLLAAIPTAIVAGPILMRYMTRNVRTDSAVLPITQAIGSAPAWKSLIIILFPVCLIASGAVLKLNSAATPSAVMQWIELISDPAMALLLANLAALLLLLPGKVADHDVQSNIWKDAMVPAGSIILSIGAGGSLKQILVAIGLPDVFAKIASMGLISPILMAWLVAAAIRVATGSATVATITASAIMAGVASGRSANPTFLVLAIGAGSVFLSHVNDPGFWLVKGYLGTSTRDTFKTWSVLETAISVFGLAMVLLLSLLAGLIGL